MTQIHGAIVETLYDHNIESFETIPLEELVVRRLQLFWKLERWRGDISSLCKIIAEGDLEAWSAASYHANRFQILLSLQYYRSILLINYPVVSTFLDGRVRGLHAAESDEAMLESIASVIKNDFYASKKLQAIIHGAATSGETFLDSNAAWWMCNYAGRPRSFMPI